MISAPDHIFGQRCQRERSGARHYQAIGSISVDLLGEMMPLTNGCVITPANEVGRGLCDHCRVFVT